MSTTADHIQHEEKDPPPGRAPTKFGAAKLQPRLDLRKRVRNPSNLPTRCGSQVETGEDFVHHDARIAARYTVEAYWHRRSVVRGWQAGCQEALRLDPETHPVGS